MKNMKNMKLSEYAKQLGISYRTAYNHFKKGLIPNAVQIKTGTIIIDNEGIIPKELLK